VKSDLGTITFQNFAKPLPKSDFAHHTEEGYGSFSTTMKATLTGFNLYLSIFSLCTGVQNILTVRHHADNPSFLKIMAGGNLVMVGLILLVSCIFFHLPPQILFGTTWLFFLLSFIFIISSQSS